VSEYPSLANVLFVIGMFLAMGGIGEAIVSFGGPGRFRPLHLAGGLVALAVGFAIMKFVIGSMS
jgi:hypothetical protein